jgi:TrpR family trp operon transcriptional repressor
MSDSKSIGWQRFIQLCDSAHDQQELDALLTALFTPEEKQQLALRVELVHALLQQSESQREIAQRLGVSIATITRGSNMLKTIRPKLKTIFERLLGLEK